MAFGLDSILGPPQYTSGFEGQGDYTDPVAPRGIPGTPGGPRLPLMPIPEAKVDPLVTLQFEKEKEKFRKMTEGSPGIGGKQLLFAAISAGLGRLVGGSWQRGLAAGVQGFASVEKGKALQKQRERAKKAQKTKDLYANIGNLYKRNPGKAAEIESRYFETLGVTVTVEELMQQHELDMWKEDNERVVKERNYLNRNATTAAGVKEYFAFKRNNWDKLYKDREYTSEDAGRFADAEMAMLNEIKASAAEKKEAKERLDQEWLWKVEKEKHDKWKRDQARTNDPAEKRLLTLKAYQDFINEGVRRRAKTPEGLKEMKAHTESLGLGAFVPPTTDTPTDPADTEARVRGLDVAGGGGRPTRIQQVYPPEWYKDGYNSLRKINPSFALLAGQEAPTLAQLYPEMGFRSVVVDPNGNSVDPEPGVEPPRVAPPGVEPPSGETDPASAVAWENIVKRFQDAQRQVGEARATDISAQRIIDNMRASGEFDGDMLDKFARGKGLR